MADLKEHMNYDQGLKSSRKHEQAFLVVKRHPKEEQVADCFRRRQVSTDKLFLNVTSFLLQATKYIYLFLCLSYLHNGNNSIHSLSSFRCIAFTESI